MTVDRPLRADARRNREKVLAAARTAFAAEGPSVPLDEIARRAGVGAGTVHRHFPTKETLIEAVVLDRLEALLGEARAALASDEPGDAFFSFFTSMIADAATKMDLAEALKRVGVDVGDSVRTVAGDLSDAIGSVLRRAQDAGAVRADAAVGDLHALVIGAVAAERWSPTADGGARIAEFMCDALRPGGAAAP